MKPFPPLPVTQDVRLPSFDRAALLLDLDGTLLDIAPTPDSVVVPPGLPGTLQCLRAELGDALAIVTGRPVSQVDALLPDVAYAVAGEHGAAIRHAPGELLRRAILPAVPTAWLAAAERLVSDHRGVLMEQKLHGFVLHYRLAPQAGPILQTALEAMLSPPFELLPAAMAWEVRAAGIDKGIAVAAVMRQPPFAGRVPIFIGDDRTDLDGIRASVALGGCGFLVGDIFTDSAGVRAWLDRAAQPA
jgi:trehalose 6-phosphate phosphatase